MTLFIFGGITNRTLASDLSGSFNNTGETTVTVNTTTGFTDWVTASGSSGVGERKAGANDISLSGTPLGSVPSGGYADFVYDDGTPTASGSSQNYIGYDWAYGGSSGFSVTVPLAAGSTGSLVIYLTTYEYAASGGYSATLGDNSASTSTTIVSSSNPGSVGNVSINFDSTNATNLNVQFSGQPGYYPPYGDTVGFNFEGATFASSVPEPSTLLTALTGFSGMWFGKRSRRKA